MKRWWLMALVLTMALSMALALGCGDDDDDDDDDNAPDDDDDDDDDTADDDVGGLCGDETLNKYAAHCADYDDPCAATDVTIFKHDEDPNYGTTGLMAGELESAMFKLTQPFHVKTIKLYFEGEGTARIHVHADLLGSIPNVLPWDDEYEPVEFMDPVEVEVEEDGWVEIDVADKDLMFLPGTKFWITYEHLDDGGYPRLVMSHKPNTDLSERLYDESWADANYPFKWYYPGYYYMITLEGTQFCEYTGDLWFSDVTEAAGIDVTGQHRTGWADLDGDGHEDMILTNLDVTNHPANIIYYKNDGDGTFTLSSTAAGLDAEAATSMSLMVDYDNDGDLDVVAIKAHLFPTGDDDDTTDDDTADDDTVDDDTIDDDDATPPDAEADDDVLGEYSVIFVNDGSGNFTVDEDSGLAVLGNLSSASFGDYDGDGYLDLYIGAWLKEYPYPPSDEDYLFHNEGDGTFTDVSEASGIRAPVPSPSYGVTWVDYDDDGDYDIFVSNYGRSYNFLFENVGGGSFVNVANATTLEAPLSHCPGNTFGADFGDLNNDGYFDALLSNIAHPRYQPDSGPTSLAINQGPPNFEYELQNDELGYHPDEGDVDPSFIDFNNDGRLDIYMSSLYSDHYSRLYEQQADGTLLDVTWLAGVETHDCTGNAWADYDLDGDLDLLSAYRSPGGGALLFRNDIGNANNWIQIKLIGDDCNRDAIGAKVTVTAGDLVQVRYVQGPRSHFGAQPTHWAHFGLGQEGAVDSIEVRWPGGDTEQWTGADINSFVVLTEGDPSIGSL